MRNSFLVITILFVYLPHLHHRVDLGQKSLWKASLCPVLSFYSHSNPQMGSVIIFALRKVRLREVHQLAWGWLASKGMCLTKLLSYTGYVSRINLDSVDLIHFL